LARAGLPANLSLAGLTLAAIALFANLERPGGLAPWLLLITANLVLALTLRARIPLEARRFRQRQERILADLEEA
jgi:hypothetical protein